MQYVISFGTQKPVKIRESRYEVKISLVSFSCT
jgi:hypothetical protein